MDLMSGLTAISHALSIAKELREIDRGVDEAAYKLKIADLIETLADTKIALSEAKEAISEKDAEIAKLLRTIEDAKSGDICPVCQSGRLRTERVSPHPSFGEVGIQEKHLRCDNSSCGHAERRMHNPSGLRNK